MCFWFFCRAKIQRFLSSAKAFDVYFEEKRFFEPLQHFLYHETSPYGHLCNPSVHKNEVKGDVFDEKCVSLPRNYQKYTYA